MLKSLHLKNYRTFEDFSLAFGDSAYLVGPNNAGKSTILTALRVADLLVRVAKSKRPTLLAEDNGHKYAAHQLSLSEYPALRESVHHEFYDEEARLELTWKSGAKLTAVWPAPSLEDAGISPFFYVEWKPGMLIREPTKARQELPELGVVPILGPVEHSESQLVEQYVRRNIPTRLASRHFRNQLELLQRDGEIDDFLEFAAEWLDDLRIVDVSRRFEGDGVWLDVFYSETASRVPKELVWAGDGLQVWLQLLYHIFRLRASETVVLDEPEVYLHPDLQRKLVRLLDGQRKQIVIATHSAEMIAEVDAKNVVLIDKTRRRARRSSDESAMQWLSSSLGTAFNLRLARALRSKAAVFVEGKDLVILRRFAVTLGLDSIKNESGITVLPLEGYSRSIHVEPFVWLCQELLPDALSTFVILDRDYRSDAVIDAVELDFSGKGVDAHVWRRKELESYLLSSAVIARIVELDRAQIDEMLDEVTVNMEDDVFGRMLDERIREQKSGSKHAVNVTSEFKKEFDVRWKDPRFRLDFCPPKQVISAVNGRLQAEGMKAISTRSLASAHRRSEIPQEMIDVLTTIEALSGS